LPTHVTTTEEVTVTEEPVTVTTEDVTPVPVTDNATDHNDVAKRSEHVDNSRVVPGSLADKVRAETVKSGHGVASDAHYQRRQPEAVSDADSLKDEDYLIDR
jgi:cytoskeletal protein RodZ